MPVTFDPAEIHRLREHASSINLTPTPEDARVIAAIMERARELAARWFRQTRGREMGPADMDPYQVGMDVANVHLNGRPLHLLRLLLADETDFAHDLSRIHRFVDRRAGGIPAAVPLHFAQSGEIPAGRSAGILPH